MYALALILKPLDLFVGYLFPLIVFVLVIVGARIFRGRQEPLQQPRQWWRFTSKPLSGFILGCALTLGLISDVVLIVNERVNSPLHLLSLAVDGVLVAGYFSSSIRLLAAANDRTKAEPATYD